MKDWYCPICAQGCIPNGTCIFCGHESVPSEYDEEYYIEKAKEMFKPDGLLSDEMFYYIKSSEAARRIEYMKNPLFNQQKYEERLAKKREESNTYARQKVAERQSEQRFSSTPNLPTCPTCHSTNIKKISLAKGYLHWRMFGFFSKTARSQWECLNCSHKW